MPRSCDIRTAISSYQWSRDGVGALLEFRVGPCMLYVHTDIMLDMVGTSGQLGLCMNSPENCSSTPV